MVARPGRNRGRGKGACGHRRRGGAGGTRSGGNGGHGVDAAIDISNRQMVTPTWCTQQSLPPGVAAADSSCVDFDDGQLPNSDGWTVMTANQGTSAPTMQRASSLPYSLQTNVSIGDGSEAALVWHEPARNRSHPSPSPSTSALRARGWSLPGLAPSRFYVSLSAPATPASLTPWASTPASQRPTPATT